MWSKICYFLVILIACGQKIDYEIEETDLECTFHSTKKPSSGLSCNVITINSLTRDTRIKTVNKTPSKTSSHSDVITFFAYNKKLRYIPKRLGLHFVNLQTISIIKTELRLLEFRDFSHMKKLKRLNLPENRIERVAPCVFRYVDTLESINLDGNLIKELDAESFANLPALTDFSANRNHIESLEEELFKNNEKLKEISLRWNNITKVEINFVLIDEIQLVDLRNNTCIHMMFNKKANPNMQLRDFQNQTSGSCRGPEVC